MASRNIASMHMFLEMKQKFPDLPEDTLRNYSLLYSEDKNKCVSLLQKESKNHFHTSQPFSEISVPLSKAKPKKTTMKLSIHENSKLSNQDTIYLHQKENNPAQQQSNALNISCRSTSHAGIVQMPSKSNHPKEASQKEIRSAPVLSKDDKPFSNMYKDGPFSSHTTMQQHPKDLNDNHMMFSTTKEHIITPVETADEDRSIQNWSEVSDTHQRHSVSLSMTPSLPFPQQQMNVYSSSISATSTSVHTSKPGKHTTSVNFQLQPQDSDSHPVEISTIPIDIGKPSKFRDFDSHLQISVGTQGATFTAVRLQRPQSNLRSVLEKPTFTLTQSSQSQSSNDYKLPSSLPELSGFSIKRCDFSPESKSDPCGDRFSKEIVKDGHPSAIMQTQSVPSGSKPPSYGLGAQTSFYHGFQASPDYVKAVKKYQLARLDLVKEELDNEKSVYTKLKSEVENLEQNLSQRREKQKSFSYEELLQKLKEENRKLRLECNCLLMEYDVSSKGQIPVGITDEDFYSNIFTGPNDGLAFYSNSDEKTGKGNYKNGQRSSEEDEESNKWKCKKCTFANHPALEKCEICELPKNLGYVQSNSNFYTSSHLKLTPSQPRRAVGSVQISVTQKVPTKAKSVKLQLTHSIPR